MAKTFVAHYDFTKSQFHKPYVGQTKRVGEVKFFGPFESFEWMSALAWAEANLHQGPNHYFEVITIEEPR